MIIIYLFFVQGIPWPDSEKNAIDIVMQYAIQRLGFHVEDIILFSWSIGGYNSTWAAMTYPDIRYLVGLINKYLGAPDFVGGTPPPQQ